MRPLYLDIDDCVADSGGVLRDIIRVVTKDRVQLKYEHILDYDYTNNKDAEGNSIDRRAWDEAHDIFSTPEVLSKIEPFPDAVPAIKELQQVFDVHFITTRLHKSRIPTIQWLDRLGTGPYSVHFVEKRRKHLSASDSVVAAVEDDIVQSELYWRKGIRCFMPARPWNAGGLNRFDGWADLTIALKRLAKP